MATTAAARPTSVRIPPDLLEQLQGLAAEEEVTLSELIIAAARHYLSTTAQRRPSTLIIRSGNQVRRHQHYFNVRPELT